MKIHILLIITALTVMPIAMHPDSRTTRGKLKAAKEPTELPSFPSDSLPAPIDSIITAGYDKALRSAKESMFVTNLSSSTLTAVELDIIYNSVNGGTMLHRRHLRLSCEIPTNETRQLEWIAWDRQMRYYFHQTRVTPRSPRAIPYDVHITVTGVR